jgi:hypothetical protein
MFPRTIDVAFADDAFAARIAAKTNPIFFIARLDRTVALQWQCFFDQKL